MTGPTHLVDRNLTSATTSRWMEGPLPQRDAAVVQELYDLFPGVRHFVQNSGTLSDAKDVFQESDDRALAQCPGGRVSAGEGNDRGVPLPGGAQQVVGHGAFRSAPVGQQTAMDSEQVAATIADTNDREIGGPHRWSAVDHARLEERCRLVTDRFYFEEQDGGHRSELGGRRKHRTTGTTAA